MKAFFTLILILLLLPFSAFSALLTCEVKINNHSMFVGTINSMLNEKVSLAQTSEIISYLTEKNETFIIEGFLTSYDARIYAEGSIKNSGDKLTASIWGRDVLIDVSCSK